MSTRQKIYIGLAVSAGVCTGVALFVYLRHRRQNALSKAPDEAASSLTPASIIASLKSRRGHGYDEITSSEAERGATDSVRFQSGDIPGGGAPLTPEQAVVLIRFLDEANDDIERLHRVLTNIANSATFTENQVNITNAGGIERLREILSTTENETTKCKVLLALNNLALNDYTIKHFSDVIVIVIDLCRSASSKSLVRLYGLNLLVNMSVLEHLHEEYLRSIVDLGSLIQSTFDDQAEMLAAGKILVNLSANKFNLTSLLKLTGVDAKTMVNLCTPKKKFSDGNEATQLEEILLRYLTFYCNLTEIILNELKLGKASEHHIYLFDPCPYAQNAVYNEIFQHDKQSIAKATLRPQYNSHALNNQIKRFRQSLDNIRQAQFEASMRNVHDELNEHERTPIIPDASTPKKPIFTAEEAPAADSSFASVTQEMNDEFADDETILPGSSSPSSQSLASFRSAYSSNDINTFTSPEKSSST